VGRFGVVSAGQGVGTYTDRWGNARTMNTENIGRRPESIQGADEHYPEPAGLGTSIAMLKRMCRDNPEALSKLDEAVTGKPGRRWNKNEAVVIVDNIHNNNERESPTGTSADAALRRLRKDAQALHSRGASLNRSEMDARHIP